MRLWHRSLREGEAAPREAFPAGLDGFWGTLVQREVSLPGQGVALTEPSAPPHPQPLHDSLTGPGPAHRGHVTRPAQHVTRLTRKWRAGDADAGTKMAARGAGAVVGLLLLLLRAGPARARVHHLTLKVRSAPPPAPLARPPGALRGAVRPARPRASPAGRDWSPHVSLFVLLRAPNLLSLRFSLSSPPAPQPARAPPCSAFAVILPLPLPASPKSRPAFSGRLFESRVKRVRGPRAAVREGAAASRSVKSDVIREGRTWAEGELSESGFWLGSFSAVPWSLRRVFCRSCCALTKPLVEVEETDAGSFLFWFYGLLGVL